MCGEQQDFVTAHVGIDGGLDEAAGWREGDSGVIWGEASRHPGEVGEPGSAPVCLAYPLVRAGAVTERELEGAWF